MPVSESIFQFLALVTHFNDPPVCNQPEDSLEVGVDGLPLD